MEDTLTNREIQLFLTRCQHAVDRQEMLDQMLCSYLDAGRRNLKSFVQNCSSCKSHRFDVTYRYQEKDVVGRLYSLLLRGLVLKVGNWWYSPPEDFVRATSYEVEETYNKVLQQEKESNELNSIDPVYKAAMQTWAKVLGVWSKLQYPECGCPEEDTHDTMHYLLRYAWLKISDLISPSEINEEINSIIIAYDPPKAHQEEIEGLGMQRKFAISKKIVKKTSKKEGNNAKNLEETKKKTVDNSYEKII